MAIPIVRRGDIRDPEHFEGFSADVPTFSLNRPLDPEVPQVRVTRQMFHGHDIPLPGGGEIEVWGFEDPDDDNETTSTTFPSKAIRMNEGVIFHGELKPRHGPHTIHWHGIEPTSANDGVGKLSFESTDGYVYQWRASAAGTYFYHCHRNTTLHFEYGMYGALIIDPPQGPGFVRYQNDVIPYDVERIWVSDDLDPRWHTLDKDAGIGDLPFDDEDPGLNRFNPTLFCITGVFHPLTRTNPATVATVQVGKTLLLRIICAGYTYQTWKLGIDAEVIAMDGRTLGWSGEPGAHSPYSRPFMLPANTPVELTPARRWDLLVRPTEVGTYPVTVEMRDINGYKPELLGMCETFINVVPAT